MYSISSSDILISVCVGTESEREKKCEKKQFRRSICRVEELGKDGSKIHTSGREEVHVGSMLMGEESIVG